MGNVREDFARATRGKSQVQEAVDMEGLGRAAGNLVGHLYYARESFYPAYAEGRYSSGVSNELYNILTDAITTIDALSEQARKIRDIAGR